MATSDFSEQIDAIREAVTKAVQRPDFGRYTSESGRGGGKLIDQFRDKMRSLHYALATERSYRYWIVEYLNFHRSGG